MTDQPKRTLEQIAVDVLKRALQWSPDGRAVGNVTAKELIRLAAHHITVCPKCGAEPWVNIDCDLCNVCADLEEE